MKKFFAEFKEFISRGNVVDLAVGMIIGSAFTAIVKSLVENIVTPLIGVLPVSYTHLDVYKRQPYTPKAVCLC